MRILRFRNDEVKWIYDRALSTPTQMFGQLFSYANVRSLLWSCCINTKSKGVCWNWESKRGCQSNTSLPTYNGLENDGRLPCVDTTIVWFARWYTYVCYLVLKWSMSILGTEYGCVLIAERGSGLQDLHGPIQLSARANGGLFFNQGKTDTTRDLLQTIVSCGFSNM